MAVPAEVANCTVPLPPPLVAVIVTVADSPSATVVSAMHTVGATSGSGCQYPQCSAPCSDIGNPSQNGRRLKVPSTGQQS